MDLCLGFRIMLGLGFAKDIIILELKDDLEVKIRDAIIDGQYR